MPIINMNECSQHDRDCNLTCLKEVLAIARKLLYGRMLHGGLDVSRDARHPQGGALEDTRPDTWNSLRSMQSLKQLQMNVYILQLEVHVHEVLFYWFAVFIRQMINVNVQKSFTFPPMLLKVSMLLICTVLKVELRRILRSCF